MSHNQLGRAWRRSQSKSGRAPVWQTASRYFSFFTAGRRSDDNLMDDDVDGVDGVDDVDDVDGDDKRRTIKNMEVAFV